MSDFQPFPITSLKTGLFNYLQPWISPEDAFFPMENAQVYRGQLVKRNGYIQLGNQLADHNPVMGIMRYQNESTGAENLVVASTKNAYLFDDGTQLFNALTSVSLSVFFIGSVVAGPNPAMDTFWPNLAPLSVSITDGTSTITDDGLGNFTAAGNFAAGGTVNYATGFLTLNFVAPAANVSLSITASSTDYFTGTIRNFFNWTNWQPTDPAVFTSSTAYLYMVNGVDPITLFNGTSLSRPVLYVNTPHTDYIETCFDIKVFKNRLLAIKPKLNSTSNTINQGIFWSQQFNPSNFIVDIAGNGGSDTAATSDILQSFNFLRDICVVRFTKSVWIFRYSGNDFKPFFFQKINATKWTQCPYASIEYDERETGIGATGHTACDGVNVQRDDIQIIDFYETEMSEQFYSQAFSQRYDNNSTAWTLYVSQSNQFPLVGGVAPGSDKALIYNFLENTWAIYSFKIPLTCLGQYNVLTGLTWAAATFAWEKADRSWFTFSSQKGAPNLLAGDTTGHVYWMDNENSVLDVDQSILANIESNQFNPFIKIGQKVQFGYIDFYYSRQDDCTIKINFYVDNTSDSPSASNTFTLNANGTDGRAGSEYAMKRIYINLMGEFLKFNLSSQSASGFKINGFILWARPAGRLTP